jgi:hypothetical protein
MGCFSPRSRIPVFWIATFLFFATSALANEVSDLSVLERSAVERALDARGLVWDDAPEGRKVGTIHVVTEEVFGEENFLLSWANIFHFRTLDEVIRRELVLQVGDAFDREALEESERLLQIPSLRSIVVILPVRPRDTAPGDVVDLLVVTRDVWSLRFNTNFEAVGTLSDFGGDDALDFLQTSLAENNLFGTNKQAALTLLLQQKTYDVGAMYIDPRIGGTRHSGSVNHAFVLNRDTHELEGNRGAVSFGLPLYSRHSKWGWSVSSSWSDTILRQFQGSDVRQWELSGEGQPCAAWETPSLYVICPASNGDEFVGETVDHSYRYSAYSGRIAATRSYGKEWKHNFTMGYGFRLTDASLVDGFVEDPGLRALFEAAFFPRTEFASFFIGGYRFYQWRFLRLYNYNTYGLAEYVKLGPDFSASVNWASRPLLGSDSNYFSGSIGVSWAERLGDGFFRLSLGSGGRLEGDLVDESVRATARVVSPSMGRVGRLIVRSQGRVRLDNQSNATSSLGGDKGLRGVVSQGLLGENEFITNVEFRSAAAHFWLVRLGGVLFYDVGSAWNEDEDPNFVHGIGAGLRLLILSMNRNVLRFDYGVPVTASGMDFGNGVLTAGFEQAF